MSAFDDKFMRVLLMFDVPTLTKKDRKNATKFRNNLIKLGFFMMQFSVYMRICKGTSAANAVVSRVREILPPLGNVRSLIITEKQFDNMQILLGKPSFNENTNDNKNLVLFEFDEKIGDFRYFNENSNENSTGNLNGNLASNLSKNSAVNSNLGENLGDNFASNLNENLSENLAVNSNLGENLGDSLDKNSAKNFASNLNKNLSGNSAINLSKNLGVNSAVNLSENSNSSENLNKNLNKNSAKNSKQKPHQSSLFEF